MGHQVRRWKSEHDEGVVVVLIGMHVNRPTRVRAWWPVLTAMPRMLRELAADPGSGFLGARLTLGRGGPIVVQYWRDRESLFRWARDPESTHRPAWRAFHARARSTGGAVGIWHEIFDVPAGRHESRYVDMPAPAGLAAATRSVPA